MNELSSLIGSLEVNTMRGGLEYTLVSSPLDEDFAAITGKTEYSLQRVDETAGITYVVSDVTVTRAVITDKTTDTKQEGMGPSLDARHRTKLKLITNLLVEDFAAITGNKVYSMKRLEETG